MGRQGATFLHLLARWKVGALPLQFLPGTAGQGELSPLSLNVPAGERVAVRPE